MQHKPKRASAPSMCFFRVANLKSNIHTPIPRLSAIFDGLRKFQTVLENFRPKITTMGMLP